MTQLAFAFPERGWCGTCRQPVSSVTSLLDGSLRPGFHFQLKNGKPHTVCWGDMFSSTEPPDPIVEYRRWLRKLWPERYAS